MVFKNTLANKSWSFPEGRIVCLLYELISTASTYAKTMKFLICTLHAK